VTEHRARWEWFLALGVLLLTVGRSRRNVGSRDWVLLWLLAGHPGLQIPL